MKKTYLFLSVLSLAALAACSDGSNKETETDQEPMADTSPKAPAAALVWSTDSTLSTPESVLYSADEEVLYVANINGNPTDQDGNGFISKVSTEGDIVELKFLTGDLNAPKGMGIYEGQLYVTDINRLVVFDLATQEMVETYPIDSALFLNDVHISPEGVVYFSDTNGADGVIYQLKDGEVSVFYHDAAYTRPNGVYYADGKVYSVSYANGNLVSIDVADGTLTQIADGFGGGDGVVMDAEGRTAVSDWNGRVWLLDAEGTAYQVVDTRDAGENAADIEYVGSTGMIYVPTFMKNTVTAYEVSFE